MSNILLFGLGSNDRFAIDVLNVREIIKPSKFHHLPNSNEFVCGCLSVRNSTIPVIDLPKMLFGKDVRSEVSMVILLESCQGNFGFKVSDVHSIQKFADDNSLNEKKGFGFIDGVFKELDGSLIQFINIDKIISQIKYRDIAA